MKAQSECGSDEMLTGLSTESCTGQGENKALTFVFWCSAQCAFLIGGSTFCVRRPVRCSTPCWCNACYLFHSKMRAATHLPRAVWTRSRKARGDLLMTERAYKAAWDGTVFALAPGSRLEVALERPLRHVDADTGGGVHPIGFGPCLPFASAGALANAGVDQPSAAVA